MILCYICSFVGSIGFGLNYTGFLTYIFKYAKYAKSGEKFGIFYLFIPICLRIIRWMDSLYIQNKKVGLSLLAVGSCVLVIILNATLPKDSQNYLPSSRKFGKIFKRILWTLPLCFLSFTFFEIVAVIDTHREWLDAKTIQTCEITFVCACIASFFFFG